MTTLHNDLPESEEKRKKKKRLLWFLLLLLTLIVLGLGVTWYYVSHLQTPPQKTKVISGDFLPDEKDASKITTDKLKDYAQSAVDKSKFQMIINPDITVNNAEKKSNLYIANPPTNRYPVNVSMQLKDGTVIYSSGGIKTGYEVKNAMLDKQLKRGTYTGTATFKLYDAETSKANGQVATTIKIVVQD